MDEIRKKSTREHSQANASALRRANIGREVRIPFSRNHANPVNRPHSLKSKKPIHNEITISSQPIKAGVSEIMVPDWFKRTEKAKVSIIIPLYRSSDALFNLANSWVFDDLDHEIIFVNDACPQSSFKSAVSAFMQKQPCPKIGRIISLSVNAGFATACNRGAEIASGEYVIFLNADTRVSPNWIRNIINPLQDDSIGIVGNLQLKCNGTIDSAGSEWMKLTRHFEHIGRNVFNGERLVKNTAFDSAPKEMLKAGERQMVTGCCVAMKKDFFNTIGGFDEGYKIGYWEDSDLCMKVWDNKKKVWFTSDSLIFHQGAHSGASGHKHMIENAKLFYKKWLNSDGVPYPIKDFII